MDYHYQNVNHTDPEHGSGHQETRIALLAPSETPSLLSAFSRLWHDNVNKNTLETFNGIHIRHFVAQDFRAEFDNPLSEDSFAGHVKELRREHLRFPEFHLKIEDVSAYLNDDEGRADIYALLDICEKVPGVTKQSVVVMRWRREGGRWLWYSIVGVIGNRGLTVGF